MTIDEALNYADEVEVAKYAGRGPTKQLAAEVRRLREENGRLGRLVDAEVGLSRMAADDKGEMGVELRRLRERERVLVDIVKRSVPVLYEHLRRLRARNDPRALVATNELDNVLAALEAVKE